MAQARHGTAADSAEREIKRERLAAFDGEFTRSIEFGNSVNVHTGRHEPARMMPPHGWSVFQLRISSLPLSVYLSGTTAIREHPKAFQSPGQQGRTFDLARVETEIDKIDGFACKLLRLGDVSSGQAEPYRFTFLWLAPERNYLPIRSERCDLTCSETLPTGSTQVAEWQELKPGVWLPSHVIALAYDQSGRYGIGSGQIVIHVREDRHVERATVDVSVSEDLFAPAARAGKVSVVNAMGHTIGEIRQRQPGPATVPDEKWRLMTATGPHDVESLIQRQTARKALIGRPAPPLVGERWLNGEPRTWDALAGNVVILFFWAEWAADLQDELAQLAVACPELAEAGIQVIGVHPAGSKQPEIEEAIRECKITWPVCIDRAHPDGHLWGSLCESLQVEYLPSAFVIDAQARIAAEGRLAEMIAEARELAKKP
ncbi:MAG TPA: TlpA disulfide reductase family protein [Pirellulales bacterium]